MTFLSELFNTASLSFILIFIAFALSWVGATQLFRATALSKNIQQLFNNHEDKFSHLEKKLQINTLLNVALLTTAQTRNNIELCSILLDSCIHKSDLLTAKALENSLHSEVSNALEAIQALEEKRAFLETKIKDGFSQLQLKTTSPELEQILAYAQVLLEETELEFSSTEKIKLDVVKVNQVLDKVLLKI